MSVEKVRTGQRHCRKMSIRGDSRNTILQRGKLKIGKPAQPTNHQAYPSRSGSSRIVPSVLFGAAQAANAAAISAAMIGR